MGSDRRRSWCISGRANSWIIRSSQEGVAHWAYNLTVGPLSRVQILVPAGSEAFARQVLEDYRAGVFEEEDDENESNMGELTD
jgi:hypothetical protein